MYYWESYDSHTMIVTQCILKSDLVFLTDLQRGKILRKVDFIARNVGWLKDESAQEVKAKRSGHY